jgi:regulator of cell morphogenesis and NO signaling
MNLSATKMVRELAIEIPNATRTFEKFGIDYCCGGEKSLSDACRQAHLPVDDVLRALEQGSSFTPAKEAGQPNFTNGALGSLIEHIVTTHHVYVKQEIPRLQQLLRKVVSVHGKNHPDLGKIERTFQPMAAELTSHMMKEEHILFPHIVALENAVNSGRPKPKPVFGTLGNPVHMMQLEHDSAGAALKSISELTGNYTPPEDACFSYKTLFTALKEFESDLHQHVHLENNILFPRAIAMESETAVRV